MQTGKEISADGSGTGGPGASETGTGGPGASETGTGGPGASETGTGGPGASGSAEAAGPSPIAFRLEPGSGVPTYLQLVHQVEQALRLGYLEPGDQLPRVKDVVGSLAINPNTVLKAYRELEHRGLAGGRPGQGTFVEGTLGRVGLPQQAGLHRALLGWMRAAGDAGLDPDGMTALFTAALRDFNGSAGAGQPARPSRRPGRATRAGGAA